MWWGEVCFNKILTVDKFGYVKIIISFVEELIKNTEL